jgi:5-methylcytosine-specific restriction endonuclease McrA
MLDAPDTTYSDNLNWVDQEGVPQWGVGPDGRMVKIDGDPRLPGLHREWLADACRHPRPVHVARKDSAGRPFYSAFCPDCGKLLRSHLPKADVRDLVQRHPDDFHDINAAYTAQRRDQLDAIANAAAERQQPGNRQSYDDYLRSPDWQRRAAKIMDRARNLCEGCLTNAASEVHHLTYAHIGNEFAFELVALCEPCHRRYHNRSAA